LATFELLSLKKLKSWQVFVQFPDAPVGPSPVDMIEWQWKKRLANPVVAHQVRSPAR
jgi:hypothetical protein